MKLILHTKPIKVPWVRSQRRRVMVPVTPWVQAGPHLAAAPEPARGTGDHPERWQVLHMRSKTPLKPVDWAGWTQHTRVDDLDLPADVRAQLHSSGCRHIDKEVPL